MEKEQILINDVLDIAMEIGFNMLKNGAEIARVEDTVTYICKSYGIGQVDVFAIPNMLMATVEKDSVTYTSKIKRNYKMTNNLYKIEAYNQLSRDICQNKPNLEEVREKIAQIRRVKIYPVWMVLIGAFFAASGCTLFFGGTALDALSSGMVGVIMQLISYFKVTGKHKTALVLLSSILGGLLSVLLVKIGLADNLSYVMIGGVMMLIPGIYVGTSLKDIILGDVLSGSVRLVQAISQSVAIATGFSMWSVIFKMDIAFTNTNAWWVLLISGIMTSIGFGITFNVKKNKLPHIVLGGLLVCAVYVLCINYLSFGKTPFFPVFFSVATGAIYSEIMARIIKAPALTLMLPSIIALVPGASLFFTMQKLISLSDSLSPYLANTLLASLGIAVGIVVSQLFAIIMKTIIIKKRVD